MHIYPFKDTSSEQKIEDNAGFGELIKNWG